MGNFDTSPIGYRILIKKDEKEEVTGGGIVLAKETLDKEYAAETTGTVLALGTNAFEDDIGAQRSVKVGVSVMYRRYSGMVVDSKDESVILINDKDVVAIVCPKN